MRNVIRFWVVAMLCTTASGVIADAKSQLAEEVFDKLRKDNGLSHDNIKPDGKPAICMLWYQHAYMDAQSNGGMPVSVSGSWTVLYKTNKLPIFSLQTIVRVMNIDKSAPWLNLNPASANITFGKQSLSQIKVGETVCDGNGLCQTYADRTLQFHRALAEVKQFKPILTVSLKKWEPEQTLNLYSAQTSSREALQQFQACLKDILIYVDVDLRAAAK